jgi:hypothetical protein
MFPLSSDQSGSGAARLEPSEDEGNMFLRNDSKHLPDYTTSYPVTAIGNEPSDLMKSRDNFTS